MASFVANGAGGDSWQRGCRWSGGLSSEHITAIESHWGLKFPPDYRLFLQELHAPDLPMLHAGYLGENETPSDAPNALAVALVPEYQQYMVLEHGPSLYNWLTDTEALLGQFDWPREGLVFDVEYSNLWPASWGARPNTPEARAERVRELVQAAPRLIPVFGHRYLLAEPCQDGNPVLSVYQSDIAIYGADLRNYLLFEFADMLGLDASTQQRLRQELRVPVRERVQTYKTIPFWGPFCTM